MKETDIYGVRFGQAGWLVGEFGLVEPNPLNATDTAINQDDFAQEKQSIVLSCLRQIGALLPSILQGLIEAEAYPTDQDAYARSIFKDYVRQQSDDPKNQI